MWESIKELFIPGYVEKKYGIKVKQFAYINFALLVLNAIVVSCIVGYGLYSWFNGEDVSAIVVMLDSLGCVLIVMALLGIIYHIFKDKDIC